MIDRYCVEVNVIGEHEIFHIVSTYFKSIDQVIKFLNRFDDMCCLSIEVTDELFPERDIDFIELLNRWRSCDEQ